MTKANTLITLAARAGHQYDRRPMVHPGDHPHDRAPPLALDPDGRRPRATADHPPPARHQPPPHHDTAPPSALSLSPPPARARHRPPAA